MLEEHDLIVLQTLMETTIDKKFKENNDVIFGKMNDIIDEKIKENNILIDKKFNDYKTLIDKKFDDYKILLEEKIKENNELLFDEIARVQHILEKSINKVKDRVDELNQYYHITKLEDQNNNLLLQRVEQLEKRVDDIEHKIA